MDLLLGSAFFQKFSSFIKRERFDFLGRDEVPEKPYLTIEESLNLGILACSGSHFKTFLYRSLISCVDGIGCEPGESGKSVLIDRVLAGRSHHRSDGNN